jgi:hypothetical protein
LPRLLPLAPIRQPSAPPAPELASANVEQLARAKPTAGAPPETALTTEGRLIELEPDRLPLRVPFLSLAPSVEDHDRIIFTPQRGEGLGLACFGAPLQADALPCRWCLPNRNRAKVISKGAR